MPSLPPNEHYKQGAWELWVYYPAPGVVHTKAVGPMDIAVARHMMRAFDLAARDWAPLEVFHDWEGMTAYTPDAKEEYLRWASGHREQVTSVSLLVRSKLLAMVLAVANLKLGYLVPFSDREAFDRARTSATLRRRAQHDLRSSRSG